jgi:TRAP-type C4-dicarboxylate transport system permease small subunit
MQMISKSLKFLWLVFLALLIFLLVVFLWAQWPMRVFASGNPRLINDMGQIAFAYFWVMAFAIACLSQSHLQISNNAAPTKKGRRAWTGFVLSLPWAIFLVYSAWPLLINSWHENEKFPDSYSPGFYLIKLALILFPVGWTLSNILSINKAYRVKP